MNAKIPSLILLPGLLNDARLWQHQISGLTDVAHATVADLTVADSMSALAASVLAKAPAERFLLAGLSMGGYTAFEIMRQAPERIIGLALLDTSARPDTPEATENRRRLIQLAEKDFPGVIDALLPKMIHPAHLQNRSLTDTFKAMATRAGKEGFVRQQLAIIGRVDSRPLLKQIKHPTLVLCGREDALTPVAMHEEIAAGIAGADLVIVEECGHLSALEQPQQVTEALRKWVLRANRGMGAAGESRHALNP